MCGIIFRSILFAAFVPNCFNQETEEVTPDLFPYQALVSGYYYCSGALITVQHVITTAHCANGTDEADVYLGFYGYPYYEDNRNEEQGQIIQSKEIIIHDNYMQISNKQFQDVAIVVLSKPAEITLYVQPIDLSTETPSLGAYAKLSGWNAREDNNLQYYPVELYDTDICIYIYGSAFLQSQLLCFQKLTTASLDLVGNPLSVNNKLETEEVTPDLFPYQALVGGYYYCSGALISVQHVITVAHCANGSEEATVYLGFYAYPYYEKNRNEEQGQIIQSKEIIIHDNYMKISNKYFQDVAIVVLSQPAEITLYVQPIDLSTEKPALGTYAKLSGWKTKEDNNLQYYPLRQYDTDICFYLYGSAFLQSQEFCYQKLTNLSLDLVGNPLSVNNKLVGLLTYNINCMSYITTCITDNIIINLSQFVPWVHEQIEIEINSHDSNSSKTNKPTHIKQFKNIMPDSNKRMINNTNQRY
ncbi:hypothetical protein GWI33_021698 [Rhynchophorus ferrugineus]|uniref:Peptidase S1 domain-containing protein n=1 Tax=Rhynchophorus ferrugineus TaxID=354439 RepID=A0A834MLK6_RHYFE|nr:hypothetical protein GWI33_021698 [Rhynchophorus ferrugineus]